MFHGQVSFCFIVGGSSHFLGAFPANKSAVYNSTADNWLFLWQKSGAKRRPGNIRERVDLFFELDFSTLV